MDPITVGLITPLLSIVIVRIWNARQKRLAIAKKIEKRKLLRQTAKLSEGMQYKSNHGIEIEIDETLLRSNIQISGDNCEIVFWDLKTSGFSRDAEILQIAAKTKSTLFSTYINPTKAIAPFATIVNQLTSRGGELFFNNVRVNSVPLQVAMSSFLKFLNDCSEKPVLLVAHNARFDISFLLRAIVATSMSQKFQLRILAFCDTLPIFKSQFPERNGEGAFKLSNLAKDFLGAENVENKMHNAEYDVTILEKVTSFVKPESLYHSAITYLQAILRQNASAKMSLAPLKGQISNRMITKLAKANICYSNLGDIFKEKGAKGLQQWLSEEVENKKPRVTKRKIILQTISNHFTNKLSK